MFKNSTTPKTYCQITSTSNIPLLTHGLRDVTISCKGLSREVRNLSGWHCLKCGECEFDEGEAEHYARVGDELVKQARVTGLV